MVLFEKIETVKIGFNGKSIFPYFFHENVNFL